MGKKKQPDEPQPLPVIPLTPMQAAHLWDIVSKQHDPLACSIEAIQSWALIPHLWMTNPEPEPEYKLRTISNFLHEWARAFDTYAEQRYPNFSCPQS